MELHRFARKLHGYTELDLCFSCQGIWFDEFESLQLAPGGVIELFELVHQHRDDQRFALSDTLSCARCNERLLHVRDRAKSGAFNYHRCLQNHGRFTTFAQFMIEKGFVRQLTGAEISELKARIDVVRCVGCGAPVDIKRDHACGHCGSPLAILDPAAVEQALATYHQAEIKRTTFNPDALAEAVLVAERDRSRRRIERRSVAWTDVGDLVVAGVEIVWGMLRR